VQWDDGLFINTHKYPYRWWDSKSWRTILKLKTFTAILITFDTIPPALTRFKDFIIPDSTYNEVSSNAPNKWRELFRSRVNRLKQRLVKTHSYSSLGNLNHFVSITTSVTHNASTTLYVWGSLWLRGLRLFPCLPFKELWILAAYLYIHIASYIPTSVNLPAQRTNPTNHYANKSVSQTTNEKTTTETKTNYPVKQHIQPTS
jgi:hypothetical protein